MRRERLLAMAVGLTLGAAGSALLWQYWTPRCNEACPAWLSLSMIGFAAALPIVAGATGAAFVAERRSLQARWILLVLVGAAAAALAGWLSLAVG